MKLPRYRDSRAARAEEKLPHSAFFLLCQL